LRTQAKNRRVKLGPLADRMSKKGKALTLPVRLGEDGTGRIHFLVATEAMISLQGKGVFKAVYRTGRRLIAVTVPVIPATGNASNRLALSHAYR
jgi:hypothetical protein